MIFMYKKYLNTITLGDCLKLLKDIPDNTVDLAFADPPFNLKKEYGKYDDRKELKEYLKWCENWLKELIRVTKPTGSICVHNIPKWLTYFSSILNDSVDFRHWIVWDSLSKPLGKALQPAHYGILLYAKDRKKQKVYELRSPHKRDRRTSFLQKDYGGKKDNLHPFGPILTDVWTDIHRIKHNGLRENHPCQLPAHLLERIILLTTDKGNLVLDPFSGTGVTAIAAKKLGRKFIAFEIDESYVTIAKEKLNRINFKTRIGNSYVSIYRNDLATIRDIDWKKLKQHFIIPRPLRLIDKSKIQLREQSILKLSEQKRLAMSKVRSKRAKTKVVTLKKVSRQQVSIAALA